MHMKTYTLHMLATLSTGEKTCEGFLLRYIDFLTVLTPCEDPRHTSNTECQPNHRYWSEAKRNQLVLQQPIITLRHEKIVIKQN